MAYRRAALWMRRRMRAEGGQDVFRRIAIWTMVVLVGSFFVLVGLSKLMGSSGAHWAVRLEQWGYPTASRYLIGAVEILAGIGFLVPVLRRSAAITLMVVMVGAFATHLIHHEFVRLLPPLVLGALLWGLCSWQPRSSRRSGGSAAGQS